MLFVDDCADDVQLSIRVLEKAGCEIHKHVVETGEEFGRALNSGNYDLILCDYRLPGWNGGDVLRAVRDSGKDLPVVLVTGTLGEETAVEMIKLGAADFVLKQRLSRLPLVVHRALLEKQMREERSRLQVQLQQAAKMEAVGRLAGGVAHDFNNLLNVIIGYSELMLERHSSGSFLEKGAREIRKAADRAAGLTRQLLAFSRQQVLEPRVLDLNEVIAEIKDLLRRMLGEDVELVVTPVQGVGRVRADPGQIGQVIMNLAANSRDAMPHGGRFIVETANVAVNETFSAQHANMPPGSYVVLSVADTGSGMTSEIRSHIFEPFFTTKEKGKGTGLGLATVYGIVKQSGGYVWVYSEPEQGATFKVYLPRVDALPEHPRPAPAPAASWRGSETLLVVEDEEGVRLLVRDYLRMNGYKVLEAEDGEDALRVAGEHSGEISLMITDVIMPGMNGRELAERMAVLRPGMKVLYISGYAETTVYRKGVLTPGAPFLQKPFSPPDLGRKVRHVLGPEHEPFLTANI